VSFGTYARNVRDTSRPHGWRVSMLRSCVQLYRPIGFDATLSFLEEIAGPFRTREAALIDALDALIASRERWKAAVSEYAQRRTSAKRHGQRSPHPREANPDPPRWWYGAPRKGALHALTYWSRQRLPELLAAYPDRAAREIAACVAACLATGGELAPDDRDRLRRATDTLAHRATSDLYHDDPLEYFQVRDLLGLTHHIRVAAEQPR
jgi:hypothetical protein